MKKAQPGKHGTKCTKEGRGKTTGDGVGRKGKNQVTGLKYDEREHRIC